MRCARWDVFGLDRLKRSATIHERPTVALNDQYIQHWFFSDNFLSYFSRKTSFKSVVHKSALCSMRRVRARSVESFGRLMRPTVALSDQYIQHWFFSDIFLNKVIVLERRVLNQKCIRVCSTRWNVSGLDRLKRSAAIHERPTVALNDQQNRHWFFSDNFLSYCTGQTSF